MGESGGWSNQGGEARDPGYNIVVIAVVISHSKICISIELNIINTMQLVTRNVLYIHNWLPLK